VTELFFCPELFKEGTEKNLFSQCKKLNINLTECTIPVFKKISYREHPNGLLALAPQIHNSLEQLPTKNNMLIIVAESIEKPGNLGTILRSADAGGADAVIVCDRCTDINNPNVIRASIGTIFTVPVIETDSESAITWLKNNSIQILAATPQAVQLHTATNMSGSIAIAVGAEKPGLSATWLNAADIKVKIPMLGQADSLNVAASTTILIYEALRQRT
jgi:TrmH family RNA methyltransferase